MEGNHSKRDELTCLALRQAAAKAAAREQQRAAEGGRVRGLIGAAEGVRVRGLI